MNEPKPIPTLSASDTERFWRRVDRIGADECWNWTGSLSRKGYGRFWIRHSGYGTQRIAWALAFGDVPAGLWVLHRCDNPSCCNPSHLFVGTYLDNVADMVAKGRHTGRDRNPSVLYPERRARGDRNGSRLHPDRIPRGERVASAKLTEDDVREIRRASASGHLHKDIAVQFGVSRGNISHIVHGDSWRHVSPEEPAA